MTIGFIYWLLILLWFLFGLYGGRGELVAGNYAPFGGNLLLFILLVLLGIGVFGWPIRG